MELVQQLADQGILGLLLALALIAVVYLYKDLKKERTARIEDMREIAQNDIRYRNELKTLLNKIIEIVNE